MSSTLNARALFQIVYSQDIWLSSFFWLFVHFCITFQAFYEFALLASGCSFPCDSRLLHEVDPAAFSSFCLKVLCTRASLTRFHLWPLSAELLFGPRCPLFLQSSSSLGTFSGLQSGTFSRLLNLKVHFLATSCLPKNA